jgi:hypothetical protein
VLRELVEHETFDRLVVTASAGSSDGFKPEDIASLLENAPGEIVVLRPETQLTSQPVAGGERHGAQAR